MPRAKSGSGDIKVLKARLTGEERRIKRRAEGSRGTRGRDLGIERWELVLVCVCRSAMLETTEQSEGQKEDGGLKTSGK